MLVKKIPWRVLRPPQAKSSSRPTISGYLYSPRERKTAPWLRIQRPGFCSVIRASTRCLSSMGQWTVPDTVSESTLSELRETVTSICDRYVYSRPAVTLSRNRGTSCRRLPIWALMP